MPKLNNFLIMSIIGDLKELVNVCNEIHPWIGDIEHQSWKFPTKNGRNINVLEIVELHKGSAGEMYILLLELAYDRINFVLRLIVEFMDKYPIGEDYQKEINNFKRPKFMSIAAVIDLVWQRLKTFPETVSKKMAKMKDLDDKSFTEKISRGSQAVSGCFNDCRSCSLASTTILDLVKEIETTFNQHKFQSFAAKERELSKFGLWDKSQWAVMSKLAEAINQDVRIILNLVQDNARISESVKRDHDNTVKRLQVNLKNRISQLDIVKLNNVKIEQEVQQVVSEMEKVRNNQLEMERKNLDLITELQETRGQMSGLAECNRMTQNQLIQVISTKRYLEETIKTLNNKLEINQEKYNLEIDQLQDIIKNLENENTSKASNFLGMYQRLYIFNEEKRKREFECNIAKLKEEVTRKSLCNRNNQNCRCTESVEKLTKTSASTYSQEKTVVKPEDNPEVDMTQQFNSNQQKIKELTRQNERLSKTIERLRERRRREVVKNDDE